MRITRLFVLLALTVLLAPRAEASRTSVWERNPPSSLTAPSADAATALASLAPAARLDASARADVETAEPPLFDLGDVVLADTANADAEHFGLGPLTLVDLNLLRGPPPSYPETRVGGFELLAPFRVGASPRLSLWSRQACGFSCLGLASDSRYDPWGLEQTSEMKYQSCAVTGIGCSAQHDANAIWNSQVVQGSVEAVGGAVQTGVGIGALTAPDPTFVSKAAGWIAVLRGLDHMAAGWRSIWARKPVPAVSDAALEGAFGGYGTLTGVGLDVWSVGRSAWKTPAPSVPSARPGATITLDYEAGWNARDFRRKVEALQDLAERGKLRKAPNPVPRDPAVAAGYKNRLIRQAYAQYGKSDAARFQSLKRRILEMHADHVQELQLLGADDAANLTLLDADVNMGIGRQIRAQIRGLDDYTPIVKVEVRGP